MLVRVDRVSERVPGGGDSRHAGRALARVLAAALLERALLRHVFPLLLFDYTGHEQQHTNAARPGQPAPLGPQVSALFERVCRLWTREPSASAQHVAGASQLPPHSLLILVEHRGRRSGSHLCLCGQQARTHLHRGRLTTTTTATSTAAAALEKHQSACASAAARRGHNRPARFGSHRHNGHRRVRPGVRVRQVDETTKDHIDRFRLVCLKHHGHVASSARLGHFDVRIARQDHASPPAAVAGADTDSLDPRWLWPTRDAHLGNELGAGERLHSARPLHTRQREDNVSRRHVADAAAAATAFDANAANSGVDASDEIAASDTERHESLLTNAIRVADVAASANLPDTSASATATATSDHDVLGSASLEE